ncbi:uncharacterized protein LOC129737633 [Uranotaenia lowii]|uniref:uncharacterized protein LOC129737633 n=1 Tax=Uranotaenia lowii TaxID=190385 RepID=UPI0024798446|nr:uncharacterized protein LOC129737633 [Uranotaenia lowii]
MKKYTIPDQVMEAELCAWAVENNISFSAVDSLVEVLKTIDPDSSVLSKLKLGRTKAGAVVTGVMAEIQHEELVRKMQQDNFSIMIDESTDLSTAKTLAIVVRILDDNGTDLFKVSDQIYRVVELKVSDHKSVYNAIVEEFVKDGIDYKKKKLKGFASDGASVMMGLENSVMRLLKKDCPDLIVIKCTCHSLALSASYACKKMPPYLEQLLRDIYSYVSHSPKRLSEFKTIQDIVELKPLRMLHPSQTRWLSLEAVVKRILERFSELKIFFSFQYNFDKNTTAHRILTHLNDPMTKPLLEFVAYVLPLVNKLNRKFQSESPEFTSIYIEMKTFYLLLLNNICGELFLKNLKNINAPGFEENILPKDKIYVGLAAEESISAGGGMDEGRKQTFREICCEFYKKLIKQIRKRFNFDDPMFKVSAIMNPVNLEEHQDLSPVLEQFKNFYNEDDKQDLENEFRELRLKIMCQELKVDKTLGVEKSWNQLLNTVSANGKCSFPLLRKLVFNFLIIPHSSASVERIFSQYNANKTKVRNRLATDTMDAILKTKSFVKTQGRSSSMQLSKAMKSKFTKSMYKHHDKIDI